MIILTTASFWRAARIPCEWVQNKPTKSNFVDPGFPQHKMPNHPQCQWNWSSWLSSCGVQFLEFVLSSWEQKIHRIDSVKNRPEEKPTPKKSVGILKAKNKQHPIRSCKNNQLLFYQCPSKSVWRPTLLWFHPVGEICQDLWVVKFGGADGLSCFLGISFLNHWFLVNVLVLELQIWNS